MINILRYLFCCKKKNVYSVNNPQTHIKGKYLDFVIIIRVKNRFSFGCFLRGSVGNSRFVSGYCSFKSLWAKRRTSYFFMFVCAFIISYRGSLSPIVMKLGIVYFLVLLTEKGKLVTDVLNSAFAINGNKSKCKKINSKLYLSITGMSN